MTEQDHLTEAAHRLKHHEYHLSLLSFTFHFFLRNRDIAPFKLGGIERMRFVSRFMACSFKFRIDASCSVHDRYI